MKKIMFLSLGFLIVSGYFNVSLAYQNQTIPTERYRPSMEYACNDLVVRITMSEHILHSAPMDIYSEIPGLLSQRSVKGIHRTLTLEFRIINGSQGSGRTWPVHGEGSNISIVEADGAGVPEDYRFIAQRLVNEAVSDGLANILDMANQFQICQPDDRGISLRLGSVARTALAFMTLESFEAIADQDRQAFEGTLHTIDVTDLISRTFFDQLTPEYLDQLKGIISMQ